MEIALWILCLISSLVLGMFGFSQIIGTIKYFNRFSPGSAIATLLIWLTILGFGAFALLNWLNDCKVALFIGYAIAFILSLRVKPDSDYTTPTNTCNISGSTASDEPESMLNLVNKSIETLQEMHDNAVRDLGNKTEEDAEEMYRLGRITLAEKNQALQSIQRLEMTILFTSDQIKSLKQQRQELLKEKQ